MNAVVTQDKTIQKAMSSYIDDIFVGESVCTVACVRAHLQRFGLTSKNPESDTRVLGLYVWEEQGKLQ